MVNDKASGAAPENDLVGQQRALFDGVGKMRQGAFDGEEAGKHPRRVRLFIPFFLCSYVVGSSCRAQGSAQPVAVIDFEKACALLRIAANALRSRQTRQSR